MIVAGMGQSVRRAFSGDDRLRLLKRRQGPVIGRGWRSGSRHEPAGTELGELEVDIAGAFGRLKCSRAVVPPEVSGPR